MGTAGHAPRGAVGGRDAGETVAARRGGWLRKGDTLMEERKGDTWMGRKETHGEERLSVEAPDLHKKKAIDCQRVTFALTTKR